MPTYRELVDRNKTSHWAAAFWTNPEIGGRVSFPDDYQKISDKLASESLNGLGGSNYFEVLSHLQKAKRLDGGFDQWKTAIEKNISENLEVDGPPMYQDSDSD